MPYDNGFKCIVKQPHFRQGGESHRNFALSNYALYCWNNADALYQRPGARCARALSVRGTKYLLVRIDCLKALTLNRSFHPVVFGPKLNGAFTRFRCQVRRTAIGCVLRKRLALLNRLETGNPWVHA